MPNWIEGTFRARGEKENIKKFIMEGLGPCGSFGGDRQIKKEITCEDDDSLTVQFTYADVEDEKDNYVKTLHILNTGRNFIEDLFCGEIDAYRKRSNGEFTFATDYKAAWGIDQEPFIEIAKKYNIDIRVNGFERGMEYEYTLEVSRSGVVKVDSFIQYEDYTWECPMPLLGG